MASSQDNPPIRARPTTSAQYDPFEIVGMMTELYELYVKMGYVSRASLKYPPHSPPIDVELAKSLGVEPQVIEIMERLPYVEGRGSEDEFFQWGGFADYRKPRKLKQSRDPFYVSPKEGAGFDDEGGPYLRPWVLPLCTMGNRGSVIFFDTNTGCITAAWQHGSTSDPAFYRKPSPKVKSNNQWSLEKLPSRLAKEFFRDIILRLYILEWIPFENRITQSPEVAGPADKEHDTLELLFRNYGWPDKFDVPEFDKGAKRYKEFKKVLYTREQPQNQLDCARDFVGYSKQDIERLLARRNGEVWDNDPDKTPEEVAKLEAQLQTAQETLERNEEEFKEASERMPVNESEAESMERAWNDHLNVQIKWLQNNLDFFTANNEDRKHSEKIKETENDILRLKESLKKVPQLPKTVEDAIKPNGGPVVGLDWY